MERIRPELNLEKWPIWRPSNSRLEQQDEVIIKRESILPNGMKSTAQVKVQRVGKLGLLTTEDQKVYYALIKIWEENGCPTAQVLFSLRRLSRILNKTWGKKIIEYLSLSTTKLRAVPFVMVNTFYDSVTKEIIEVMDVFNILSELKIVKRKTDGHITKEAGYFRFNDHILKNLLNNYTKPLLMDVVISFKSEIAQILYTYLDLIMAGKTHYERKTKDLFNDLNIEGKSYQNLSDRKRKLEKAFQELRGVQFSSGILDEARLEETKDGKDCKAVFVKKSLKKHYTENIEEVKQLLLPKVDPLADDLVKYFHQRLNRPNGQPTSKELDQAMTLIADCGNKQARYVVDYAIQEAEKTKFQMRTFGAVFQYQSEAIKSYEAKRKEQEILKTRQVQAEREKEEKLQRESREKEELDNLYHSLTGERKDRLQILIHQKFNRHPFKPSQDSPLYELTMNWAKYETLKVVEKNLDLLNPEKG